MRPSNAVTRAELAKLKKESNLERLFASQLDATGIIPYTREYRFAPPRRWRFDFAFPDRKVAVEIEGGVWSKGRHTRPLGFVRDAEKYNAAQLLGWTVYRFTGEQVEAGTAILFMKAALS